MQDMFIVERVAFKHLCESLVSPCSCHFSAAPWKLDKSVQKGHVLRAAFKCRRCHSSQAWASSRHFGGRYLVNQKLVHSFTCAGILPRQYVYFSTFAGIGTIGKWYIHKVYKKNGYMETVAAAAECSMVKAVEEANEKSSSNEWVITDARHDLTSNAYHTTVPCLSGSTKKVVGVSTISRLEHASAQTREVQCTRQVLPEVIERGLKVVEVAHDYQPQVQKYVVDELKLINSYDTWHGTKNVAKAMAKIAQGAVRSEGVTWFRQLSDKRKGTKTHLYWSMRNCNGSPDDLRASIMNISKHYQGIHDACHRDSLCHKPDYVSMKVRLTDQKAIEAYEKALKSTAIYRYAESYCRCRDTFWVESLNHQMLLYVPKRIHFGSQTFKMRMNLAVLDWNENVQRGHTSECTYVDIRRPNRRTPLKVLVEKTFRFVDDVWSMHVKRNMQMTGTTMAADEEDDDEQQDNDESDLDDDGNDVHEEGSDDDDV